MNDMEASRSHVRLGKSRARRSSQQVLQKPALCVHPENGAAHAHAAPCIDCVETGHSRASPDNAIPAAAVRAAHRADRKCRLLPHPTPCQCTVVRLAGARNRRERLHCFPVVSEVPFVGHEADDSGRDLCSDRMNGNTELLYISRRGAQCWPVIGKAFRDQRAGCRQPRQTGSRCRYRRRADAGSSRTKLARC